VPTAVLCAWDFSSAGWSSDEIDPREWAAAAGNVAAGSAPSSIAAGSDVPSDETVRRWQQAAAARAAKAAAERKHRIW